MHMNNLLLACMTRETGIQIGATIGIVIEFDVHEDGIGWGNYLRVKIEIDLRKMIARGRTINLLGNKIWVPLSYDKLQKLCFGCGGIIHGVGGCDSSKGNDGESQYGTWLHAQHNYQGRNMEK